MFFSEIKPAKAQPWFTFSSIFPLNSIGYNSTIVQPKQTIVQPKQAVIQFSF